MDDKYMQAALRSLETSKQFTPQLREAIARAIEAAILEIHYYIPGHTHPELDAKSQPSSG